MSVVLFAPRARRASASLALLAGALLAGGISLATPSHVVADHGQSSGDTSGSAGCRDWIKNDRCERFDEQSPVGAHSWAASGAEHPATSGRLRTQSQLSYQETYVGGMLASVVVTGHIRTGNSGGGRTTASADYSLDIEVLDAPMTISGSVSMQLAGSEFVVSDGDFEIDAECGEGSDAADTYTLEVEKDAGSSEPNGASASGAISKTFDATDNGCQIDISAFVDASTNREAPGESGSSDLTFNVTITLAPSPGCNGLSGDVADGLGAVDGHDNWLRGIRVELRRDGQRVGRPVATNDDGSFCLHVAESQGVEPGDFQLRATLADATQETPLFETRHAADGEAAWVEIDVHAEDFGPDNGVVVSFASTPERPWLADVANIHWQSERFVRWIRESLGISGNALGSFTIVAYDTKGTQYDQLTHVVSINSDGTAKDDSKYADRNGPNDESPENGEWHEIGHHLAHALAIAPTHTAPACADRIPHGGWLNATTCDSLAEGFAMFVATLASLDIDADQPAGYATAKYSLFTGTLEDNAWRPWSWFATEGEVDMYREDFAVSDLLWDLADDTADEDTSIALVDPEDAAHAFDLGTRDRVAIGGANLINLMAEFRPTTVDELYQGLVNSPNVPSNLKAIDLDLGEDDVPDISPLQEVFLAHGFHPTENTDDPRYTVGTPVGRTDHESVGGALAPRPHAELAPGANVLVRNTMDQPLTFTIDVSGPMKDHREVVVAANSQALVYLEVVPYWRGAKPATGLPACGGAGQTVSTISVTAPGQPALTLDSCAYLHAVAEAVNDVALTYAAGPGAAASAPTTSGPSASGTAPPILGIALGGIALAAGLGGLYLVRRRATTARR
jgi:hypothetical protein